MSKTRSLAAGVVAAALAVAAVPAQAALTDTTTQVVAGIPTDSLALSVPSVPVVLTNFKPGSTASGSGQITVTSTLPNWTLTVADLTANKGQLGKIGNAVDPITGLPILDTITGNPVTCPATSQAKTNHVLKMASVTSLGGATAGAAGDVTDTPRTVATGHLIDTLTTGLQLPIDSAELLSSTCLYNTTLTYTAQ
ncbi:MAG TPA: hypothetical protein VH247_05195 [Thermoleophilaceae bacterium]|nr:hypothetical protein [Thermoleophilaceae bacterium]